SASGSASGSGSVSGGSSSSLASDEEGEDEEGKKVPGPRDPSDKSKTKAKPRAKSRPKSKAEVEGDLQTLPTPTSMAASLVSEPVVAKVEEIKSRPNTVNFQTAGAVVVLAVAAAAVFWKTLVCGEENAKIGLGKRCMILQDAYTPHKPK
ncbi:hypothetical protein P691DRAFT_785322, partial [Macrolepiota fuliginosa MF-IS2]